jgi:hypothetical protein
LGRQEVRQLYKNLANYCLFNDFFRFYRLLYLQLIFFDCIYSEYPYGFNYIKYIQSYNYGYGTKRVARGLLIIIHSVTISIELGRPVTI